MNKIFILLITLISFNTVAGGEYLATELFSKEDVRTLVDSYYELHDTRAPAKEYLKLLVDKDLYMCFPIDGKWYLVLHDELVEYLEKNTPYLSSSSWIEKGGYSSRNPNKDTIQWLSSYCVG